MGFSARNKDFVYLGLTDVATLRNTIIEFHLTYGKFSEVELFPRELSFCLMRNVCTRLVCELPFVSLRDLLRSDTIETHH